MRIVIDSNRVIAALIKDSTTRELLFNENFEFFAPDLIIAEITKYKKDIIQKADITQEEFEITFSAILTCISVIPKDDQNIYLSELQGEIDDPKDIPYIASCLSINTEGIWTHDPHFKKQNKVKVFTNIDLLKIIKEK